jgi:hypothetical protein
MERRNRRQVMLQREEIDTARRAQAEKGHKKGHGNVPFWVLDGFVRTSASALERMAGTTGLEPATSAVTESQADVTYWKLTVLTARSYSFKGTRRKSSTSLSDPDRTQIGRSEMNPPPLALAWLEAMLRQRNTWRYDGPCAE